MKQIMTYIGYFMGITAFATAVWQGARAFERTNTKLDRIEVVQKLQGSKIDSICKIVNLTSDYVSDQDDVFVAIVERQEAQRRSYVNFLRSLDWLERDKFLELLEGLEFQIRYDTIHKFEPKITIRKKQ